MHRLYIHLFGILAMALIFASCQKDNPTAPESLSFDNGLMNLNEVITGTGGMYTVTTKHVTLTGTFAGIIIAVDKAHVNLEGALIDGSLGNTNFGVGIHLLNRTGVHVTGGTVQNCNVGVLLGEVSANTGGGSKNHIKGVVVRNSRVTGGTSFDGDGIVINNGTKNHVKDSQVSNVGGSFLSVGIRMWNGSDNHVNGNTVESMKAGSFPPAGILLQGTDDSNVQENLVTNGAGRGIWAATGALGNILTNNTSLNNSYLDLEDGNPNCDSNIWRDNTFATANQSCIQ